jgi:hypothetical protein
MAVDSDQGEGTPSLTAQEEGAPSLTPSLRAALAAFDCAYLPEHQVLVCRCCRYALAPDSIATHFHDTHRHPDQSAQSAASLFSEHLALSLCI